jgi:hypothetical protein
MTWRALFTWPYNQIFGKKNIRRHYRPPGEIKRRLQEMQESVLTSEYRERAAAAPAGSRAETPGDMTQLLRAGSVFSEDALKAIANIIAKRADMFVLPADFKEYIELGADKNGLMTYRCNGRGSNFCETLHAVGRCRLTVSRPELKARLVSALEIKM